jgi:maleylacetoacetate isomerase
MKLYHYWRSSASWRVRWFLACHPEIVQNSNTLELIHVSLLDDTTETPEHLARHPLGAVPVLQTTDPHGHPLTLTQSVAILHYLNNRYLQGQSPLFVKNPHLWELIETIQADTHPLQNLPVQDYLLQSITSLTTTLFTAEQTTQLKKDWSRHWIQRGLFAYEKLCAPLSGDFSIGNELTLADLFLIPQCYNALRYEIDLNHTPRIAAIYARALKLETCQASHPDRTQPH